MRCLADTVQLLRNEWISTIDLNGPRPSRNLPIKRAAAPEPWDRPDGFVLLNLGQLSHIRGATWPENRRSSTHFSVGLRPGSHEEAY